MAISLAAEDADDRNALVPVDPVKAGEEDAYVKTESTRMLPVAIRELKHQLLYSSDSKERRSAADKFLELTGHTAKDGARLGSSPLVVIMGVDKNNLPWVAKTVEGQVINGTDAKDNAGPVPRITEGKGPPGSTGH